MLNEIVQGKIISVIVGDAHSITLLDILKATFVNSLVGLLGYYFAAFTIDKQWMGRVRMQVMGFLITFILFLTCGYGYDTLVQSDHIPLFQLLYYLSSFFAQWGPNATTWLLPVELFPTDIRSQAHGISAAAGKLGALAATLIFSFGNHGKAVSAQQIFQISGFCCLAGLIMTIIFVPDFTSKSLKDVDQEWFQHLEEQSRMASGQAVVNNTMDEVERVDVALLREEGQDTIIAARVQTQTTTTVLNNARGT